MQYWLNIFIISYMVLFFGVVFLWRTYRLWKTTGINAYQLVAKTGPESITARYFRILPFISISVAVIYIVFPDGYQHLGTIEALTSPKCQVIGIVLMIMSLLWVFVAQIHMGTQWRIGLDHEHDTELVCNGIFSWSRNPIFFGIIISAWGYFLLLPNTLTLLVVVLDIVLIQVQVALEEVFLLERHGDRYKQYCQRVRRWL